MARIALLPAVSLLAISTAAAEPDVELPTIAVTRESADGPVAGYIAKQSRTGTKTDTPLDKTPQSITVVPREQMEDQAVTSVAESLRYSAGLFTEYRGTSNQHDEMYIRGFGYVPRFLDGLLYGSSSLGQLDPYLLERIEVLRGPSSILYGELSPGGMVNLVSKRPTGETVRSVEAGVGNDRMAYGAFDLMGVVPQHNSVAYRFVGKYWRTDTEDMLERERVAFAPSISFNRNGDTRLTVQAFYQNDPKAGQRNFRQAAGLLYPTKYGYIPRDFQVSDPNYEKNTERQYGIGYKFEHDFNNWLMFRQNVRYADIDYRSRTLVWNGLSANETTISRYASDNTQHLRQWVADQQLQAKFGTGPVTHTVLAGLDYRYTMHDQWTGRNTNVSSINWLNPVYGISNIALTTVTDTTTRLGQTGIYAQDQIEIGKLNILIGGRQDWAETDVYNNRTRANETRDSDAFTWRAGAIYNLPFGVSPYASYSTSFEAPTQSAPSGSTFEPVTAQQYEFGVKLMPEGAPYQLTASYFNITQQNILKYDSATASYYQVGEGISRGWELEGRVDVTKRFQAIASYSRTDTEITKSTTASEVGLEFDRVPRNQASLWLKYDFYDTMPKGATALNGLGLALGVRYIGNSTDRTNTLDVPSVTLLDAAVYYDLEALDKAYKGVKLQVNATNLEDKYYVASCASSSSCFIGTGRTVTASLKYTW